MAQRLLGFVEGVTSVYTVTSAYATFAEVPGTARNLVFELILSPSTSNPIDFRLMQGLPRLAVGSSDVVYNFPATTYLQKSSDFTMNTTKGCYLFALQARQSTAATTFAATVQSRWIGIS